MDVYAELKPDDPINACNALGTILATSPEFPEDVKKYPQCYLKDCMKRGAYKTFQQQDQKSGKPNCPDQINCTQIVNLIGDARMEWSGITQKCPVPDPPVMGPNNPPDLDRPDPDDDSPDPSTSKPNPPTQPQQPEPKPKPKPKPDIVKPNPASLNIIPLVLIGIVTVVIVATLLFDMYIISGLGFVVLLGVIGLMISGIMPIYESDNLTSKKYVIYGTNWCGYTTKQKNYLSEKYGSSSYEYVDCDLPENKNKCKDFKSFPVTRVPSGKLIRGFNEKI